MQENKLKVSQPIEIINLYDDYLPLDGEDSLRVNYSESTLDVIVEFCSKHTDLEQEVIIRFSKVNSFLKIPFPGYALFDEDLDPPYFESLVEYQSSEFVDNVTNFFEKSIFKYKHYRIFFLSVNITVYVIAESVRIIEKK